MTLFLFPKRILLFFIKVYQKTLSFDHGTVRIFFPHGYCKFHPTCSEYGYIAIGRYGIVRGGLMAAKRILKCNPFSKGGIDPVL